MSGWQCPEARRFRSALETVNLPRNNSNIYCLYAYLIPRIIIITWAKLFIFHWSVHGIILPKQQTPQGWHLWGIFCVRKSHKRRKCCVWTQKTTKLQPGLTFPSRADQGCLNKPQADWRTCWIHRPQIWADSHKKFFLSPSFVLGQQNTNQALLIWKPGWLFTQESRNFHT